MHRGLSPDGDVAVNDGAPTALLGAADPPVFEIVNADGSAPLLLVCDHASRAIPAALDRLGLSPVVLERHIAYDIGAAALTRLLAARLDAPAVLAGYSRLVIDLNRQPGDAQSILEVSDGIVIPGNLGLGEAEQAARAEIFHWPYHHAVDQVFAHLRRRGPEPLLLSVHTFTPSLGGEDRTCDIGVLWNRDPRLAVPLIDLLRRHGELRVGDNEPYSGRTLAYTINLHAGSAGLAHAAIEIRQDHCETAAELDRWADLLNEALDRLVGMDHLHRAEHF
jgi:predicted N-formylglutamate amidohydrolase